MSQHNACRLYSSKMNSGSAQLIKNMAMECMHRQKPRIPYSELTRGEEHVSRLNRFMDSVSVSESAMHWSTPMMMHHLQVLDADSFGSMEQLQSETNETTMKHVKGLILKKLKTQMSSATKTDEMLKAGIIDGELTLINARSLQGLSNITFGMKVHPCNLQLLKLRPLRQSTSPRRRASVSCKSHIILLSCLGLKNTPPSVALEEELENLREGAESDNIEGLRAVLAAQQENLPPKVRIVIYAT